MATKRIDDVGRKVSGLRKDRFRAGMSLEQLRALSPEEAEHHVTKDNVWPAPDYAALIAGGKSPSMAAFVKVARDRMSARPALGTDPAGFAGAREDFVTATLAVRDVLLSAVAMQELRNGRTPLAKALGLDAGDRTGMARLATLARQVMKDRSLPHECGYRDQGKVDSMLGAGFPGKVEPWRRTGTVAKLRDGLHYPVSKGLMLSRQGFETEEAAERWLKERYEATLAARSGARKTEPSRPHLDAYVRTGMPDWRGGRNVTAEELMREFGFGGVAFGNWLPDHERQAVVDMGYDSLCDLSHTLGIPRAAIGLDARLVVAFGAMGNGGAAATYHSADPAVNMTRFNGAGSLAHEWGHAFDDWSAEVNRAAKTGVPVFGSGHRERTPSRLQALSNLEPSQAAAWDRLMATFWSRPLAKDEALGQARASYGSDLANMESCRANLERQLAKPFGERNRKWVKEVQGWLPKRERFLATRAAAIADMEAMPAGSDFGRTDSRYLAQATAMGGKDGSYWTRPTEMFARAFECWVHDRIAAAGGSSPYLVHGVEEDRFAGDGFTGNPYPVGEERKAFAERFGELVEAMGPLLDRAPSPSPR